MTESSASALTAGARSDVERWFLRRGVPQLIDGYSSEPRMDSRAAPLIVAWLAVGSILFWATSPCLASRAERPPEATVGADADRQDQLCDDPVGNTWMWRNARKNGLRLRSAPTGDVDTHELQSAVRFPVSGVTFM